MKIPGLDLKELDTHSDGRGFFMELFRQNAYPHPFVQANRSFSRAGVLRGLHYHVHQDDLWHVAAGRALVACVDLRHRQAPPEVTTLLLDGALPASLFIPRGVAHGFRALTDMELIYWVTNEYDATDEHGVAWDDPGFRIDWGPGDPEMSERDRANERLDWDAIPSF